eukprot:CAMPEP_0205816758 /NCGR_PEP_ID=MMETSP0205-20121125/23238_1 /ASSEMBLY_ACC=CAM_ASM_000278 /TAXON_ID=36767 /ORGANISM="Euplotes focardii, Strain TN1" /LENGTH=73 /DNA_ID=CAMNT_0053105809 /DNA_START=108 /DNA_END=329 /DNA_ORIENTATION=+
MTLILKTYRSLLIITETVGNKDDYFSNLQLRDELDKYIDSTKHGQKQEKDNKRYKAFVKDHEEKGLWSRRKKE